MNKAQAFQRAHYLAKRDNKPEAVIRLSDDFDDYFTIPYAVALEPEYDECPILGVVDPEERIDFSW